MLKVSYNNLDWDKTDKEEVDMLNKSLEVSESPIMALDSVYDAGRKLLNVIEADDQIHVCEEGKLLLIIDNFLKLVDRLLMLPHNEGGGLHDLVLHENELDIKPERLVAIKDKLTRYVGIR